MNKCLLNIWAANNSLKQKTFEVKNKCILLITMTLSFDLQLNSRIFLKYIVPVYFAKNLSLFLCYSNLAHRCYLCKGEKEWLIVFSQTNMKKLTGVIVNLSFFFSQFGRLTFIHTVTTSYKGNFQEGIGVKRGYL